MGVTPVLAWNGIEGHGIDTRAPFLLTPMKQYKNVVYDPVVSSATVRATS